MVNPIGIEAGKLVYHILSDDGTRAGINSAISGLRNLDTSTKRFLSTMRQAWRDEMLTTGEYAKILAATLNNVANTSVSASQKIHLATQRTNTSVGSIGSVFSSLGSILSSVGYGIVAGVMTGIAFSAINTFTSILSSFTNFVAEFTTQSAILSGEMQKVQIAFETMMGNASDAKNFIEDMWQFALESPFEFNTISDSARKLLAYNFSPEEAQRILKATGDAAAALGQSSHEYGLLLYAIGQVGAFGALRGQEAMQLVNGGVPVWNILAEKTGIKDENELRKAVEERRISGDQVIEYLLSYFEERYSGAMERMNKTFTGQITQFKESVQYAQIQLGDVLTTLFSPALLRINEAFKKFLPELKKWSGMIQGVITGISDFWDILSKPEQEATGMSSMEIYLDKMMTFLGNFPLFSTTINAIKGFIDVCMFLFDVFSNQNFWNAIFNFAQAWLILLNTISTSKNTFADTAQSIKSFADDFASSLLRLSEIVLTVVSILTSPNFSTAEKFGDLVRLILTYVIDILQNEGISLLYQFGSAVIDWGISTAENTINGVIDVLNKGLNLIFEGGLFKWVNTTLAGVGVKLFKNAGKDLAVGLIEGLKSVIKDGIDSISGGIKSWIDGIINGLKTAFGLTGLSTAITIPGITFGTYNVVKDYIDTSSSGGLIPYLNMDEARTKYKESFKDEIEEFSAQIDALQAKYGLNVTLADLQKKYGVNTNLFQEFMDKLKNLINNNNGGGNNNNNNNNPLNPTLNDLKNAIKGLDNTIQGKNFNNHINIYVDADIENANNKEEVEEALRKIQDTIVGTLTKKGIIAV